MMDFHFGGLTFFNTTFYQQGSVSVLGILGILCRYFFLIQRYLAICVSESLTTVSVSESGTVLFISPLSPLWV